MKRVLSNFAFLVLLFLVVSTIYSFAQNVSAMDVHVDKAVAIPGNVLEPGDYVFRLLDRSSGLGGVAVTSADGKTFYGIIPVYAANRDSGDDREVAITAPDEAGLPRIDSWYFPGSRDGYRFIYSPSDIHKADMMAQQMQSGTAATGK